MKWPALLPLFIFAILLSGCASKKTVAAAPVSLPEIVTPDRSLAAKVISSNAAGRFVILNFAAGQMPKSEQIFFLYRNGLKVGEVKISGPQRENNIVADVTAGDAQTGDEAREQ